MEKVQIKISDILKYIVLGLIEIVIILCISHYHGYKFCINDILSIIKEYDGFALIIFTAALALLYFIGYLTQYIILLFFNRNLLGTGTKEVAEFIRKKPIKQLIPANEPDWVHWSNSPGKVISAHTELLEGTKGNDDKLQFLYTNQLFQGICFVLIIATPFTCYPDLSFSKAGGIVAAITLGLILLSKAKRPAVPYFGALAIILAQTLGPALTKPCLLVWPAALFISFCFAILLANRQINRFDILAKGSDDDMFQKTLCRFGIPKAYVLVRAHQTLFLEDALESIAKQDYPNIKVVVLIDKSSTEKKGIAKIVEKFRKPEKDGIDRKPLNILCAISKNTGPAAMAYEIREIYLKYANNDDISIMLDSDDEFYSPTVVSDIMTKMFCNDADVCLLAFEVFGLTSLNFSMNAHNNLVKKIAAEKPYWTPEDLEINKGIHHISTIGWTKCYRKELIDFYHQELKKHYTNDVYCGNSKYEDFPDIVMLLKKGIKICALKKNAILFRKRDQSTTTNIKWSNYSENIPYFLKLCITIANAVSSELIKDGVDIVEKKLIPYKITQYYNILATNNNVKDQLERESPLIRAPHKRFIRHFRPSIRENIVAYLENDTLKKDLEIFDIEITDSHIVQMKHSITMKQRLRKNIKRKA